MKWRRINIAGGSTLNFGAPGQDGTIVWTAKSGRILRPSPPSMFRLARSRARTAHLASFSTMRQITVAAGATLDLAGNGTEFANLTGGGSVIDSGAADDFDPRLCEFLGVIPARCRLSPRAR